MREAKIRLGKHEAQTGDRRREVSRHEPDAMVKTRGDAAKREEIRMQLGHHQMTWTGYWKEHGIAWDMDRFLSEVKEAGYDAIEMGGDAETLGPAEAMAKKIADHGLKVVAWGIHVTANPWPPNTQEYRRALDYAAAMGVNMLAVCGGFLGRPFRAMFDSDYKLFAQNLRSAAEYGKQYRQTLAFHPHCGCMVETQAEVERLLAFMPELDLLVDTGHLIAVRSDPIALMLKYPRKIKHVHLKDWDPGTNKFMEPGRGSAGLNFAAIVATLRQIEYGGPLVVERDDPPRPALESAKISRAFLKTVL
jgi:inosose dehydratase